MSFKHARHILEEDTVLNLIKTVELLQEKPHHLMKQYAITTQQYNVLRILYVRGGEGLCSGQISKLMINRIPDMTRLLDRMEKSGLIVRVRSQEDRRKVQIFSTPKGQELCLKIDTPLYNAPPKSDNKNVILSS